MKKYICILFLMISSVAVAEENALYAYQVIDLETLEVIREENPNKLMLPASTLKLITAYAGLKELGGNFQFETKVLSDGAILDGELTNNLYIKFDGNPDFTYKDIESLAYKLKNLDVNNISGDIIIDDFIFDEKLYPEGWLIENKKFAFAAPISAIVIDQNKFHVELKENGQQLELFSKTIYPKIENEAKVIDQQDSSDCELELSTRDNNTYKLYGCHKKGDNLPLLRIAIQDPRDWIKELIKIEFSKQGIKYRDINFGMTPIKAQYLFGFKSRRLNQLIEIFLQESNNLIGEVIFKTLGFKKSGVGSWKQGKKAIEEFIFTHTGIRDNEIQILDGSGLSRKNLISTNLLVNILQRISQETSDIKTTLFTSLPRSNESGTLLNRFIDNSYLDKGSVVAKTGSLDNVSALAGYILREGKEKFAFVIMVNNTLEEKTKLKANEEKILASTIYDCVVKK